MGGKRSDQYNIDPGEAGSTDHKWRGEGRSADEHIKAQDKQELQSNPHDQPMIPTNNVNPAARELQERKAHAKHSGGDARDEESGQGSSRDKVDEASEESFPASDPPAQP